MALKKAAAAIASPAKPIGARLTSELREAVRRQDHSTHALLHNLDGAIGTFKSAVAEALPKLSEDIAAELRELVAKL